MQQAQRAELGPGEEEEFQRWSAQLREATDVKGVEAAELRIGKARPSPAVQERLAAVAQDQRERIKGGR